MTRKEFEKYIMPASEKMYRYAFSILKNTETAADVVQECLMKIWDKRKTLEDISNYESWAMRITRNQCYDWVRINRFSLVGEDEINAEDNSLADKQLIYKDFSKWIKIIINSLPEKNREIFHLREVEEMSYQDIAEVVNISLSEVKISLHRTRSKIKTEMQKIENYGVAN